MTKTEKLVRAFYKYRAKWYRANRLLFPSPAEVRLIEIMGGKYFTIKALRHRKTKFPLTIVVSLGKILESERFAREVRVGRYFVDFGNDLAMALEVDGKAYHRDIVREFERDSYLYQRGWRVVHIPAIKLWNDPLAVQHEILRFVYR